MAMQQMQALRDQILLKVTPSKADRLKVDEITRLLEQKVVDACKKEHVAAIVRVEGSVAKDTWLSENPDIDVFMRLPISIPKKSLGDVGLKIAKRAAEGFETVERFAEHPYLEIFVQGYRADIVPCYDAKPGEWQSATDRTPYHTDYIKKNLSAGSRDEVRLLKKFMQGIGVYGAEIKIGGFSGYLCELLIVNYGSFVAALQAFATYNQRKLIDIKCFYAQRQNELSLLFPEQLVIVDPVDKARNVASAVQPQKLYSLIGAARAFLKKPSQDFFYPPAIQPTLLQDLKQKFCSRGSAVVFLVIDQVSAVPDVLWGQLYKTKRSMRKLLEINDFKVLKDAVWSNEKNLSVFLFELEMRTLSNIKRHVGPPLQRDIECERFLEKYSNNPQILSGPYIEEGRWIVEIVRKTTEPVELLKMKFEDGGKNAGAARLIAESISRNLRIMVNGEIDEVYSANHDFAVFLTTFLVDKPFWLS